MFDRREEIVAHPSPGRKGWRAAARILGILLVAAIVALPISFIGGMMMTPLLWRLEPVLGMELAGHSGPSDWILATLFGFTTILVAALLLWLTRPRSAATMHVPPGKATHTGDA